MQKSDATNFQVGGTGIWSPNSISYTQWAEKNTFAIGDSIGKFIFFSILQRSSDSFVLLYACKLFFPIEKQSKRSTRSSLFCFAK